MAVRKHKDRMLDKDHPDILIHYSETFVSKNKNPYIVVNLKGEILDDAQGYGFKTSQNARKAYVYKMRNRFFKKDTSVDLEKSKNEQLKNQYEDE